MTNITCSLKVLKLQGLTYSVREMSFLATSLTRKCLGELIGSHRLLPTLELIWYFSSLTKVFFYPFMFLTHNVLLSLGHKIFCGQSSCNQHLQPTGTRGAEFISPSFLLFFTEQHI